MNPNIKKKIAAEVLLLFGTLLISGLFFLLLTLWNILLEGSIAKNYNKNEQLKLEIDKHAKDIVGNLYRNGISEELNISYIVEGEEYIIPKKMEKDFVVDFPSAKKQPSNAVGYTLLRDSSYSIEYVTLVEFRALMRDTSYRTKFYNFASGKTDLGSLASFNSCVQEGFEYYDSLVIKPEDQYFTFDENNRRIQLNEQRLLKKTEIFDFTLKVWIILLGLIYLLRPIFIIIRWSIKTLKE